MAAFSPASPPFRSSGWARGRPASSGVTSKRRIVPASSSTTADGPVVVSSSVPSLPWTTQTHSDPRLRRTSAMGVAHLGSNTPISWRAAPAGLASGPSRLKTVRVPSSTRVGPTWRMAPWCRGAMRKPIPASHKASRTSAMSASMVTPRAASRSAEPEREESARLPCLATGTPQPAATSAAAVEMLNVPLASPPVPQVSMVPSGASIFSARARIACAPPVISSTVSPRTRSAIRKPPIWDGVASPAIIASKAARDSFTESAAPLATRPMSALKSVDSVMGVRRPLARSRAGSRPRCPAGAPRVIAGSRRNAMRGNASSNDRSWHSVRDSDYLSAMMDKSRYPHLSPALSAPRGGEGEMAGATCVPPPPCRAVRPAARDRASRRMARSQASGASARRLREMNGRGTGRGGGISP